ncbi:MAG: proton-translocating transhydrogenase family protein [Oligoflexia bacterium]
MSPTMIGITVFVLSCFIGYHVIWGVTPALHTPLMAVTNAISAIVVVGAILVAGHEGEGSSLVHVFGFLAVTLASINIFGGFVVTNRILAMFKPKPKPNQQEER